MELIPNRSYQLMTCNAQCQLLSRKERSVGMKEVERSSAVGANARLWAVRQTTTTETSTGFHVEDFYSRHVEKQRQHRLQEALQIHHLIVAALWT